MTDDEIRTHCRELWGRIPRSYGCENCRQGISYDELRRMPSDERVDWVELTDHAGAVRLCASCREPRYPWAKDLDPGKVREWLAEQDEKHGGGAFLLDFDDLHARCMP